MVDEIKKEEVKQEAVEPERKDIVLMAKIDKDGMLVEEIPHDQRITAYLLLHLTTRVQNRHQAVLNHVKKMEDERKKPDIITSIRNGGKDFLKVFK